MSPLSAHRRIAATFFISKWYIQTTRVSFVAVLFLYFLSLHLQECDNEEEINFFFKQELQGYRLTGTSLASLNAFSAVECALQCSINNCCRAVNYKKKGQNKNCELLHILASNHREFLKEDKNYDYYVLLQPNLPRMCSCLTCDDGNFCLKENCSCTLDPEKKTQCTDGNFIITLSSKGYFKNSTTNETWGHAIIKINGKDYSHDERGFNYVVLDGQTGYVEQSASFDTHDPYKDDANKLVAFLNEMSSHKNKIILVAVKDEASYSMKDEGYDAISKIAGEQVKKMEFRGSFALIGFSGQKKPSFVKQVRKNAGPWSSDIEEIIHIPVVNN